MSIYTINLNRTIQSAAALYKLPGGPEILRIEREMNSGIHSGNSAIVNISKDIHDLRWFIDPRCAGNKVSAAETMINDILDTYRVEYHNEVSFYGLQYNTGGYARYDWFFPVLRMCCEYDGQLSHCSPEQVMKDKLKDKFCADNDITLIRWNKKHYYRMEEVIEELMGKHHIYKR